MKTLKQKALFAAVAGATALTAGSVGAVTVNDSNLTGQVLIYPYFTARNGQVTLVSVVNTATAPKVVKVRFLEGKNSAEVLDFNLFLSPSDVWTGAVVETADKSGAGIVWSDTSCTTPKNPGGVIPFSNAAYAVAYDGVAADSSALGTLDRTKEGYLEVIEMAEIVPSSALGRDVTHVAGKPACLITPSDDLVAANLGFIAVSTVALTATGTVATGTTVTTPTFTYTTTGNSTTTNAVTVTTGGSTVATTLTTTFTTQGSGTASVSASTTTAAGTFTVGTSTVGNVSASALRAPSGGLFGNGTVLNANGSSTGYNATALDDFWAAAGQNNQYTPTVVKSGSNYPNIAGNVQLGGASFSSTQSLVVYNNLAYLSSWAYGIQAVGASLMRDRVMGEYAFTTDGVIGTDWIITMPTKRYHANSSTSNAVYTVPVPPFSVLWNGNTGGAGTSCDTIGFTGVDREEAGATAGGAIFSPAPPGSSGSALCYEANVISFGALATDKASRVTSSVNFAGLGATAAIQNGGVSPIPVGKEGGWGRLTFPNGAMNTSQVTLGYAAPNAFNSTTAISLINVTQSTTSNTTYFGLPIVGFVFSGAAYNAGNPAQNYSNSYHLVYGRKIQ